MRRTQDLLKEIEAHEIEPRTRRPSIPHGVRHEHQPSQGLCNTHTHTHTHTHTNLHLHIYIDRETNGHNDEKEEAYTPLDDEKEEGIHTTRQTNTPLNKPTH